MRRLASPLRTSPPGAVAKSDVVVGGAEPPAAAAGRAPASPMAVDSPACLVPDAAEGAGPPEAMISDTKEDG